MGRRRSLVTTADRWSSRVPRILLRPRYCTPYPPPTLQRWGHSCPSEEGCNTCRNPKHYKTPRNGLHPRSLQQKANRNNSLMASSSQTNSNRHSNSSSDRASRSSRESAHIQPCSFPYHISQRLRGHLLPPSMSPPTCAITPTLGHTPKPAWPWTVTTPTYITTTTMLVQRIGCPAGTGQP
jgi:hypothetical protein